MDDRSEFTDEELIRESANVLLVVIVLDNRYGSVIHFLRNQRTFLFLSKSTLSTVYSNLRRTSFYRRCDVLKLPPVDLPARFSVRWVDLEKITGGSINMFSVENSHLR